MQLSKQQVNTILDNAPAGVDKKKILDNLVLKGYDLEGVDSNLIKQNLQQAQAPQEQSFLGGLKQDLNTRVDRVNEIQNRPNTAAGSLGYSTDSLKGKAVDTIEKGVQTFGQGAGLAANAIEKTAEQIPGVKQVFGAIGAGIDWLSKSDPIKALGSQIGNSKTLQEATRLYDTDPNFRDSVDAVANIARLGGDVQMASDAVNFTKNVTSKIADKFKGANLSSGTMPVDTVLPDVQNNIKMVTQDGGVYGDIKTLQASPQYPTLLNHVKVDAMQALNNAKIAIPSELKNMTVTLDNINTIPKIVQDAISSSSPSVGSTLSTVSDNALKAGTELKNNIQLSIAKKSVSPQLESSANRLFLDGTKNLESPVATYDKYLAQSKNALKDIKADPAISVVGEKMGNAFETVVKQRSAIGKVLGDELKTNGSIKVSIVEPKTSLLSDLKESGLSYNPKTNRLTSFQGSKFAPEEVKMLNTFVKDVTKLGDKPSVSQIDNFIAKTRSTLEFTKGKAGVTGTSNAERIIKGGIAKLRATLDPAVNGNKALTKYWNANKTYSQLSDFVDEGSGFLGKKTLSGDFAKDASVAKSSVQSILNQGKKDFMIKLEALTGYKAIDDAVLALQAMKDAGDFRGLSLLQAMSDTGIPTSKAGITQKILDYALSKGGEFVAGTPEEQTRALLQSLEKSAKNPTIVKPTSSTTPKTGARIRRRSQPKSSKTVIPK